MNHSTSTWRSIAKKTLLNFCIAVSIFLLGNEKLIAQPFNTGTITIDGAGGEAAYTSAASGNGTNVKMAWDDTYLYIYYSAGVAAEPFNIFIDTDPSIPVATGGNGAAIGAVNFGITPTLPIKADFQIYWTGSFAEYRTVSAGSFGAPTAFNNTDDLFSNTGNTNRELRVRWTTMGLIGRPPAFNWMGYANSTASFIFNQVPDENPSGGGNPQSPVNNYYYTVSTTASSGATNPFSQKSYESRANATMGLAATTLWDYTLDASGATTHTFTPSGTIDVNNALLISAGNTFTMASSGGAKTLRFGSTSTNTPSLTCNGTLTPNNGSGNDLSISAAFGTTTIAGSAANTAYRIFNLTVNSGATVQAPSSGTVDLGAQFGTITVAGTLNFVNGSGVVNLTNNGASASAVTISVTPTGTATFNNVTGNGASPSSITLANVESNGAARLSFNNLANNLNNTIIASSGGTASTAVPITIRGNLTNNGTFTTLSTSNNRFLDITVTGSASILNSSVNISYRGLTIANIGSTASNSIGVTMAGAGAITIVSTRILTISTGARLDINTTSMAITSAICNVNGFFKRAVSTITGFSSTTFFINNGGTYEHNLNGGSIPLATWNTGSNCSIIGWAGSTTAPANLAQNFSNFTWNCSSQTSTLNMLGNPTSISGNLSVLSTGSGILRLGTTTNLSIGGDFLISSNATNTTVHTANGTVSTISIGGNLILTQTANVATLTHNGVNNTTITFNKATSAPVQQFSSSGTISGLINFNVGTGSTFNIVQLASNVNLGTGTGTFSVLDNAALDAQTFALTGSAAFTLSAGGRLITANTDAVGAVTATANTTAGSVRVSGTKTYNAAANYTFNNSVPAAQFTGAALTSAANLTINNSAGVTLSASNSITSSTLTLTSGILTTNANTMFVTGSVTRTNGWVNGNLQRTVATGNNIFNIGTATVYAPSTINMTGVSGPVQILGKVTQGVHPNEATSGVDVAKKANHYWTMTKSGAGTFTSYTGTFNVANTTNGGTVSNYKIAKFDAPSIWSAVGGSAAGNDVTSASFTAFSDFIAGEFSYTLSYDANGGTGTDPASSSVEFNAVITTAANPYTRTGYTFTGWNTAANGSGTAATAGGNFTMPASNTTLYAQWCTSGTWTGAVNNDWDNDGNWCGGKPTSTSDVIVPAGATINIGAAEAVVNSVTIAATGTLIMTGAFNLSISSGGSFNNGGTFTTTGSTGKVIFLGDATTSGTISYTGLEFFGNVTTNGNVEVNGLLSIPVGKMFVIGGSSIVTLNGTIAGTGTIKGSSTAGLVIGGTGALGTLNFEPGFAQLASLTMNRTSNGTANLGSDVEVGVLTLTNGVLTTNGNLLTVSTPPITGGSAGSFVGTCTSAGAATNIGGLKINGVGSSTDVLFPVGSSLTAYNPATLNNSGTTDDFTVRVGGGSLSNTPNPSVQRIWDISEGTPGGSNVALTFGFMAGEEESGMGNPVYLVHADGNGNITERGPDNTLTLPLTGMQTVTSGATRFTSFSPFGITSGATILPIGDLISFDARKVGNAANINWTVSASNQFKQYEVMRSTDGRNFITIASVGSVGSQYMYQNNVALLNAGTNYFRLKITEKNGTILYSKVAAIVNRTSGIELIGLTPTLVKDGTAYLNISAAKTGRIDLVVYDITGKRIRQIIQTVSEGNSSIRLDLQFLASGMYTITGYTPSGNTATIRFVKE